MHDPYPKLSPAAFWECNVDLIGADALCYRAGRKQNPGVWPRFCVRINRVGCYFVLFVVYQICGAPFTPDFSIALFNSDDAANALACSRLWKA